jgi:hypothetical protein
MERLSDMGLTIAICAASLDDCAVVVFVREI